MSLAIVTEINSRLRAAGITVHEWSGWQTRGNGTVPAFRGGIVHHTGSPYGFAYQTLVTGRTDLAGPLCNYAGNEDGSVTVIAAGTANHAGASGGYSMGPLPVTTSFNKYVLGLEIVYPGTTPMRDAQYRTACVWARIVADVVGGGNVECVRAHAETSVTGKWDPGYAFEKTINMAQFRAAASTILEDNVALTPEDANLVADKVWRTLANGTFMSTYVTKTYDDTLRELGVANSRLAALQADVDELQARPAASAPAVDLNALAAKVAELVVPAVVAQVAAASGQASVDALRAELND